MIDHVLAHTLPAALALLPPRMDSPAAKAMLLAIGLQESRFLARRQLGDGPARGFWQFELAGVRGVLQHPTSRGVIADALRALRYQTGATGWGVGTCHAAIEHNDTLACCFARTLLFTLPDALPGPSDPDDGWRQYTEAWRPGKPYRETWDAFYTEAWARVAPPT